MGHFLPNVYDKLLDRLTHTCEFCRRRGLVHVLRRRHGPYKPRRTLHGQTPRYLRYY